MSMKEHPTRQRDFPLRGLPVRPASRSGIWYRISPAQTCPWKGKVLGTGETLLLLPDQGAPNLGPSPAGSRATESPRPQRMVTSSPEGPGHRNVLDLCSFLVVIL